MATQLLKHAITAALTTGCLLGPVASSAADSSRKESDALPSADAGECYAKVNVPAVYKTETVSALIKEASEKIEIKPAKFETVDERVLIKDASTRLIPVPAVYDKIEEKILISPASTKWVRSSLNSNVMASPGLLADLEQSGVDIDAVEPGRCYYEFHKTATYNENEDKFLIEEASEELKAVPAQFSRSSKQVMIKAASKKLLVVPATFSKVTEKIMIEPAHAEWRKGRGPIERIDNSTGEIMCRINVPARYEEMEKQVVQAAALTKSNMVAAEFTTINIEKLAQDTTQSRVPVPAKYETFTRRSLIEEAKLSWLSTEKGRSSSDGVPTGTAVCFREFPAEYKTFKRKVVKTPGTYTSLKVPAEYKTLKVQKLTTDASERRIPVPEIKTELLKRIKISDARLEWRPVLCETNMTKDVVAKIQAALNNKGYSAGSVDGVIGRGTLRALEKFQEDESLAQGGLTHTTIEALGVKL